MAITRLSKVKENKNCSDSSGRRDFSVKTYCVDNASEDVVAWVLVLVVLISVRIGDLMILKYLGNDT